MTESPPFASSPQDLRPVTSPGPAVQDAWLPVLWAGFPGPAYFLSRARASGNPESRILACCAPEVLQEITRLGRKLRDWGVPANLRVRAPCAKRRWGPRSPLHHRDEAVFGFLWLHYQCVLFSEEVGEGESASMVASRPLRKGRDCCFHDVGRGPATSAWCCGPLQELCNPFRPSLARPPSRAIRPVTAGSCLGPASRHSAGAGLCSACSAAPFKEGSSKSRRWLANQL